MAPSTWLQLQLSIHILWDCFIQFIIKNIYIYILLNPLIVSVKQLYVSARPLLVTASHAAPGAFLIPGKKTFEQRFIFRIFLYWVLNFTNLASQNYSTTHTTYTQKGKKKKKKKKAIYINCWRWRPGKRRVKQDKGVFPNQTV